MLTLFSSSHIGAPQMCTNMAFSYWPLKISVKHFDEYLKFGEMHVGLKLGEVSSLFIFHHNFLT